MEYDSTYPRFLNNSPCGEDLFEGKSQQKIALNICKIIKFEKSCNIIGIDGGWGAGKSNLVSQIQKILITDNYHFFIYDAWGHQEDLQRRSFLEELTENLTQENLIKADWKNKLDQLLAKAKKTESKRTPKLSIGVIVVGLAILTTPLFKSLADKIEKSQYYGWSLTVLAIPLIAVFILFIYFFYDEKADGFKCKLKNSFNRLFLEYQNKLEEETKYEMISEEEPSVRKFRNWMNDISKDLGEKKLVLVFDNMDRLPQKKVQELWSSIHVFFSEHSYENIKVIIPFDREHIKLAFKSEDNDKKQYGDDFINKTFNVVYRVSPPILSDWKKYFTIQWKEAFGEVGSLSESNNILQIFDLLSEEITPRRIIAFINEFVSIKHTVSDTIPNNYIAIFILGKPSIVINPILEIINPTYLKGMSYLYKDDNELPKYISALFYQVEPETAIQIIFTNRIKWALNENNANEIEKISAIPDFYYILENAIVDVTNFENAILALNELPSEKIGTEFQIQTIWNSLYKKVTSRLVSKISEFQLILLSRISNKIEYLNFILNDFIADPSFSSVNYYDSINILEDKFKDRLPITPSLKSKETNVHDFIGFVRKAKSEYKKYKIEVNPKELNEYLVSLEVSNLKDVDFLEYINKDYSFNTFTKRVEELIKINKSNNDSEIMGILYKRYKEVSIIMPLIVKLDDTTVYDLFSNTEEEEEFYYDLIAMRIAKLNKFDLNYSMPFDEDLNKIDDVFVEQIATRLEYYISYGEILLGLKTFSKYPLFKRVAQKLTIQPVGKSKGVIGKMVTSFKEICLLGGIEPSALLARFEDWSHSLSEEITKENIKDIASPFFFKNVVGHNYRIGSHCIDLITEYLNGLSEDEWKEIFKDLDSYEVEVSLIINYEYSTNAFEALKFILNETASNSDSIPDKIIIQKLIDKLEEQGRNFKATFNNVRDSICRGNNMSISLFEFFGDWLFKYADLENNEASLRTIFPHDVVKDNDCLQIIVQNQEKMPKIIDSAKDEALDFKSVIKDILETNDSKEFVTFAKSIGVKKVKKRESDSDKE